MFGLSESLRKQTVSSKARSVNLKHTWKTDTISHCMKKNYSSLCSQTTYWSDQPEHEPDARKCSEFLSSSKCSPHFQVERLRLYPPAHQQDRQNNTHEFITRSHQHKNAIQIVTYEINQIGFRLSRSKTTTYGYHSSPLYASSSFPMNFTHTGSLFVYLHALRSEL